MLGQSQRWTRNSCIFWCTLLLLQEFRIVLLLNIEDMKNSRIGQDDLVHTKGEENLIDRYERSPRDSDTQRIRSVLETTVQNLLKENGTLNDRLNATDICDFKEDEKIREFWRSQGPAFPLYLVSSAIQMTLISCGEIVDTNIRELLDILETEEIIGLIQASDDLASAITEYQKSLTNDSTSNEQGNQQLPLDPESPENEAASEAAQITAANAQKMQTLSEVFYSLNSSQARSISGIEDELDETINEYEILSTMFLDDSYSRRKRSVEAKEMPSLPKSLPSDIKALKQIAMKRYHSQLNDRHINNLNIFPAGLKGIYSQVKSKVITSKIQTATFQQNVARHSERIRRDLQISDGSTFMIKHESRPCKVLSVFNGVLQFRDFRESYIKHQLWILKNGNIQNYESGLFLNIRREMLPGTLVKDPPVFKIKPDTHLTLKDYPNCSLHVEGVDDSINILQRCNANKSEWKLITFNEYNFPLSDVVCYFVIQDLETCEVVTATDTSVGSLSLQSIDEGTIANQLWYRDGDYIRHSKSSQYLTSGLPLTAVQLMSQGQSFNQRWSLQNGSLIAKDLYGNIGLATQNQNLIVDYFTDNGKSRWNFTLAKEGDIKQCLMDQNVFVIKHNDFPCKTLCSKNLTTGPSLSISIGVPSAAFVSGFLSGLLSCFIAESKTTVVVISVTAGLSLAVVAGLVVGLTTLFDSEYNGVGFENFDEGNPNKCLWYSDRNTIRSVASKEFINLESSRGASYIELSSESPQQWTIGDGYLSRRDKSCYLSITSSKAYISESDKEIHFKCNYDESEAKWERISTDNSVEYFEKVNCFYFLQPVAQTSNPGSCGVLTQSDDSDYSVQIVSDQNFINQLWYIQGDSVVNVGSGRKLNETYDEISRQWTPVEMNEGMSKSTNDVFCEQQYFFIKNEASSCKMLSVLDGTNIVELIDYNHKNLFNHLWRWDNNKIVNVGTGFFLNARENVSPSGFTSCRPYCMPQSSVEADNSTNREPTLWEMEGGFLQLKNKNCSLDITSDHSVYVSCQNPTRNVNRWKAVQFDLEFTFSDEILCPFLIQNQQGPCGVLTGDQHSKQLYLRPVTADLIQSQLWYKSGGLIISLSTGSAIGAVNGSYSNNTLQLVDRESYELTWVFTANQIVDSSTQLPMTALENSVKLARNRRQLNNVWHLFDWMTTSKNMEQLQCPGYNRRVYFIKNYGRPCKVLTADSSTNEPVFQVFNEKTVSKQLWYFEYNRVINFDTGLAFQLETYDAKSNLIKLRDVRFRNNSQHFTFDSNNLVHVRNATHSCYVSNGEVTSVSPHLTCSVSKTNSMPQDSSWELVDYEKALEDISKIMCILYIRNNISPCEFLTGLEKDFSVRVRPMTNELIQSQVFYWKDSFLVHKKTEAVVTFDNSTSRIYLSDEHPPRIQSWQQRGNTIISPQFGSHFLTLDASDDGKVKLRPDEFGVWQNWSLLPINYDFANEKNECAKSATVNSVFFIKSTTHPCLVLTRSSLGNPPTFEVFDQNRMEHQLWYRRSNHLINYGSQLAIMLDPNEMDDNYDVIMWHTYEYSIAQKWNIDSHGAIRSLYRNDCSLVPFESGEAVSLETQCDNQYGRHLEFIDFDNNAEYFDKVTCFFFIKSLMTPCELVTGLNTGDVKMRPLDADIILNQQWFWKGDKLVNVANNRVLTLSYGRITLGDNRKSSVVQQSWTYKNSFIKRITDQSSVVTITSDGFLSVTRRFWASVTSQKWILIDAKEGMADPNKLHCESGGSLQLYVIRSERDRCPLLARIGDKNVGVVKDKTDDSVFWTKKGENIINAGTFGSLTLKGRFYEGMSIYLEQRYAFESYQKWDNSGNKVRSLYRDRSMYLTYTGSSVRMYTASSYQGSRSGAQIWKWYTVDQIEDDDKLLRCSRCYNKGEEKAAEIMGWIPIFGWLYNLGRSIAYGVKNCPDVALSSFRDFIIDAGMDLITVLSAGSASAVAYGIKTGIKLGFKAGVKAFVSSIKAMIKNAVKSVQKGIMKAIRGGFRATLKRKLVSAKFTVKYAISAVKKIPRTLKSITTKSIQKTKSFVKKGLKSTSSFTVKTKAIWKQGFVTVNKRILSGLKRVPKTIKTRLGKLGKSIKARLKKFGDDLAQKSEDAIKKSKGMSKPRKVVRCKRNTGGACVLDTLETKIAKTNNAPNVDLNMDNQIRKTFDDLKLEIKDVKGQSAVVGVKQKDEFIKGSVAHNDINTLRNADAKPLPKDTGKVDPKEPVKTDVQHVEQNLFENLEKSLVNCKKENPCDVYLFSKLSPCTTHPQSYAQSCIDYIAKKCKTWWETSGTRCKVGFNKFYADGKDAFSQEWDATISKLMGGWKKQTDKLSQYDTSVSYFLRKTIEEKYPELQSKLLDKLAENGFDKIIKSIPKKDAAIRKQLNDKFNEVVQWARKENSLDMAKLSHKFRNELKNVDINDKTRNNLVNNFQSAVDKTNIGNAKNLVNGVVQEKATLFDINRIQSDGDYIKFFQE